MSVAIVCVVASAVLTGANVWAVLDPSFSVCPLHPKRVA